jgi:membrane associated rhomboid family serine protease
MYGQCFHLLGNLFFFFCFSSIIERRVTPLGYLLIFAFITVFQNTIYHITSINNGIAIPSIGLSGVVWGYMALFLTLTPKANVDCFVWYLWVIKRVEIPAWIFILGFFALDIGAFRENDSSNVNHIAHFGGFVAGILARVLIVPLVSVKQNARSRLSKRTKPSW